MILTGNLDKYQKYRLRIGEIPILACSLAKRHERYLPCGELIQPWSARSASLELALPRHCSSYALLGLRYVPESLAELRIEVLYNEDIQARFEDSLSQTSERVFSGICAEYSQSIADTAAEAAAALRYPPGHLTFDTGAFCEVGSSKAIFQRITKILMKILPICDQQQSREEWNLLLSRLLKQYK